MPRIGQILVERGWITDGQLRLALRNQRLLGGRLGTCLLEMEVLTEALLLGALADQRGLPPADADDLRVIPPDVIGLLPARLALRYQAVPFRALGGHVDLVMLDVRNLVLQDEIAFYLGKRLNLHLALEVRVVEALHRFYGGDCSSRLAQLLERINRELVLGGAPLSREAAQDLLDWDLDPVQMASLSRPTPPPRHLPGFRHEARAARSEDALQSVISDALSRSAEFAAPEASAPLAAAPPAPDLPRSAGETGREKAPPAGEPAPHPVPAIGLEEPSWDLLLSTTEHALLTSTSARDIGAAIVEALAPHYARVLLFKIGRGHAEGWMGSGLDVDGERLEQVRIALDRPGVLSDLRQGAELYHGALAPTPVHLEMARCWGGALEAPCLLLAIRVSERLVSVLYLDRAGATLPEADLPRLLELTARVAGAFQRCIIRNKLR